MSHLLRRNTGAAPGSRVLVRVADVAAYRRRPAGGRMLDGQSILTAQGLRGQHATEIFTRGTDRHVFI